MKLIIAGSRGIYDAPFDKLIEKYDIHITGIVSGMARGIDSSAAAWALGNGFTVYPFYADWQKHGKSAGPRRNRLMAEFGDALLAIWDGESRGTKNMIEEMKKLGKPVFVEERKKI